MTLHYKQDTAGSSDWYGLNMVGSGDVFSGTIKGGDHRGSGMDYYFEAEDSFENNCFLPDAPDAYHFALTE